MATGRWENLPLNAGVFANIDEASLRAGAATLENLYINEVGGHTRFPGLEELANLGEGQVYLHDWQRDLVAVTSTGKVYSLDEDGNVRDRTGVVPVGGRRATFAKTDDLLMFATGGPILELSGNVTTALSDDAPISTHVGYIDGYGLAIEKDTQLLQNSNPGAFRTWDPLNIFAAEAQPDFALSMLITDFREIIIAGADSFEQFEPFPGGPRPFFRRWSVGEGIAAPYTLIKGDNSVWALNSKREFVRFSGQSTAPISQRISVKLQEASSLDGAWAAHMNLFGQNFIMFQFPEAENVYGTMGITFLYDYLQKKFSYLYGWDTARARPIAWPGRSYHTLWGRHFVGGADGKVYELKRYTHNNDGAIQRMFGRSAHFDQFGDVRIDDFRMRFRRGLGNNTSEGTVRFRSRFDDEAWSNWQEEGLGKAGDRAPIIEFGAQGSGHTWQFEYMVSDDVPVDILKAEARITRV